MCERAATRLHVSWPAYITKTGPMTTEMRGPAEPGAGQNSLSSASSLNCEAMESKGLLQVPSMEQHVAANMHPQRSTLSSYSLVLHSRVEKCKIMATTVLQKHTLDKPF